MQEVNPGEDPPAAAAATKDLQGYSLPRPLHPPPPTYWPFITAVGLAMGLWGVVLNLLVICVGVGVFSIGMCGLIGDWVREHRNETT